MISIVFLYTENLNFIKSHAPWTAYHLRMYCYEYITGILNGYIWYIKIQNHTAMKLLYHIT